MKLQLDLRIRGTKEDVDKYVNAMSAAIPNNVITVSKPYPQTRYDKNSKEVAVYVKLSN